MLVRKELEDTLICMVYCYRIIKVGVNVYNLARRLELDHDLAISGTLDLRALSEKVDFPDRM